jgi:hypothetical protein
MSYFLFIGTSMEGSSYYAPQVNKNSSFVGLFSKMFRVIVAVNWAPDRGN